MLPKCFSFYSLPEVYESPMTLYPHQLMVFQFQKLLPNWVIISDFGGRYNFPLNIMFSIVCFFCRYEMWYRGHLCHLILLIMFTKKWLNSFLASMKQSHGWAFQKALVVKNLLASPGGTRDMGLIPESGRSPGGRNGSPLQCSCLEDPEDRGAWRAAVLGVGKSQTGLSS